jgi:hypothetical protein
MKNYFSGIALLFVLLLPACRVETPAISGATHDPRFRVAEPNKLFFKNIRQIDYRQTASESQQPEVYIHANWPQQPASHWRLAITHHWLADEAYLRFIPPAGLADSSQWKMVVPGGQGQTLDLRSLSSQDEAGERLLQCLQAQKTVSLQSEDGGQRYELFVEEIDQKSGMTTLHDYFQLVSKR